MHFQFSLILYALLSAVSAIRVTYNGLYADALLSLNQVTCSDGPHGLVSRGYATLGSLPSIPYVGAASLIAVWDDVNCGTCWSLTYNGVTINVLLIDHTDIGFSIATEAMQTLTGGRAVQLIWVDAEYAQVDPSNCGLGS